MSFPSVRAVSLTVILALCSGAAAAQYVWQDERGVRQYSDTPPPASVPPSRILKSPGLQLKGPPPPPGPKPDAILAEKNEAFLKRRAEAAEKEKQDAEKAQQEANRQKACEQIAQYRRQLESGDRIRQITPSGERTYMTDEERAKALKDTEQMKDQCR
ncbi:DUF4124 domain-containing protein [Oxalicibacterium faecigallinarum]|uniref:DUF4124 domain-containing protein n=1 Tax=Oxalicibacterium faecigallinarum TaxID=573741 RepID=A0A8J3F0R8_9BURK|nr:DUF4124 domain-containing protein [Oxalicibacterium faecigallinarum]GGI16627.1 hypothetical protein GCM10008066_04910 [Oxalicibacterium faecigallinarum]